MKMKWRAALLWSSVILTAAAGFMLLLHLWTGWPAEDFLWKFVVTCGVLVAILAAIVVVGQNISEENDQRKDRFLN